MDEHRARTRDDLRGLIQGDLLFDEIARSAYAHDASLFEIDPLGVVVPRSLEDLVATVRYAGEQGLSIHARGAGTGLAGECLGPGLVIDFSRYFNRVVAIGSDYVDVQPGAVLDAVNAHLGPLGRRLGPDPSESSTCTIGGLIAGNGAGPHSLREGTAADAVERLDVVFASGQTGRLGCEPWPLADREPAGFVPELTARIARQLRLNADLIARMRPRSPRNRAGYALDRVATPAGLDLARLVTGSEGTLALIHEARLRTVPVPSCQAAVLLCFARRPDACEAIPACLQAGPSACEMLDWRRLALARDVDLALRDVIAEHAQAALVVEFEGDDPAATARAARSLADRLLAGGGLIADPLVVTRRTDVDWLLGIRKRVAPLLLRSAGASRPVPLVEDIAVPPDALEDMLQKVQTICRTWKVNWTFHAHAGDGQLHVRPFLDLSTPADRAKLEPLHLEIHDAALALGGSLSGEHGCGLLRTPLLRRQYGDLVDVFREVKLAFDPENRLNPGKIVSDSEAFPHQYLRRTLERDPSGQLSLGSLPVLNQPLRWEESSRAEQIAACGGCGDCRTTDPALRMCPTFRGLGIETASPRAQVNLLRRIATGELDPRLWGSEELRHNADLCVHCRLCRRECPAGIDVSRLMLEAKAAYVENHGLSPTDWTISRLDVWARWGSRFPVLSRALLGSPRARWWLERLTGLSRHRVLPRPRRRSFVSRADRLGLTRPHPHESGPRVAYFVDLFANHFDPELAESVVAVLRHLGVNVYVPKGQRGCGMPSLVVGDFDRARELLITNLRVLSNAVRDGYTVVCSEPTAALMLRELSLSLTDDLDAELVARNTMDVGQYLLGLVERDGVPKPTDPLPARVGYHQPCHLRALDVGTPGLDLLRMIPGLEVEFIDRGCSGIAGVYGLSRRNFRTSLRAGRGLRNRLKDGDLELGSTECGTCRMQMEQGLSKPTLHPLKLLSMAYGLDPALRRVFKNPKSRRVIS